MSTNKTPVATTAAQAFKRVKPLLDKPVGVHSRYADMTFVKEKYGWEPKISIKEGMRRVFEAQKKNLDQS